MGERVVGLYIVLGWLIWDIIRWENETNILKHSHQMRKLNQPIVLGIYDYSKLYHFTNYYELDVFKL